MIKIKVDKYRTCFIKPTIIGKGGSAYIKNALICDSRDSENIHCVAKIYTGSNKKYNFKKEKENLTKIQSAFLKSPHSKRNKTPISPSLNTTEEDNDKYYNQPNFPKILASFILCANDNNEDYDKRKRKQHTNYISDSKEEKLLPTKGKHKIIENDTYYDKNKNVYLINIISKSPGIDLIDLLYKNNHCLSDDLVKEIMLSLCNKVKILHDHHFSHMDLRLENVIYDSMSDNKLNRANIIDFGTLKSIKFGRKYIIHNPYSMESRKTAYLNHKCAHDNSKSSKDIDIDDDDDIDDIDDIDDNSYEYPLRFIFEPIELFIHSEYDPKKVDIWRLGVIMHLLSFGYFPSVNENGSYTNSNVISNILQRNLLERMLCSSYIQRLSIDEILSHEWFDDIRSK